MYQLSQVSIIFLVEMHKIFRLVCRISSHRPMIHHPPTAVGLLMVETAQSCLLDCLAGVNAVNPMHPVSTSAVRPQQAT